MSCVEHIVWVDRAHRPDLPPLMPAPEVISIIMAKWPCFPKNHQTFDAYILVSPGARQVLDKSDGHLVRTIGQRLIEQPLSVAVTDRLLAVTETGGEKAVTIFDKATGTV
jgi:hypothetical protein